MKHLVLMLFFLLVISPKGSAQEKTNLKLLDIFDLEYVSDPQISPDGSKIVYVRNFKDIMTDKNLSNLWIINFDGSDNRPLTTGNHNDNSPKWSHDGKKIIYKSNKADDKTKLYLLWLDSKAETALTNGDQTPSNFSWSYDDQTIAFTMFVPEKDPSIIKMPEKPKGAKWQDPPIYIDNIEYRSDGKGYLKPGHNQIFTIPITGGTPKQLTFEPFDHSGPVWATNNRSLYFSANTHKPEELEPGDSEIYRLSLTNDMIKPLTNRYGPDSEPTVSPDGKTIAYLGYDDKFLGYQQNKLYLMNSDGTNSRLISKNFDRSIESISWNSNGKELFFIYKDEGKTKLASISLSRKIKDISDDLGGLSIGRPYNSGAYSVSNTNRLAYTLGGTEHPSDLGVTDIKSSNRLTHLNADLFSFKNRGKVQEMWWNSSYDQHKIQGWLVTPPHFDPSKKYPFILEIHGGPFLSYGAEFSAEIQEYAAAGYVVLYCNPRGSTSYGIDFGNEIHHNYPSHDYDDLMSGVDAVLEKGFIDKDNLFVTGGSGGGVLTAWIVGKTDRFRAAVVAKPVINWYSFVLYSDNIAFFSKYWFAKKPWEDPESYLKRSPLSYVGNVTTPTMVLGGEEDYRTPLAEAEQFYGALKLQNVPTAMVRIPGASHGIAAKPSNLVAKMAAILSWFDKYRTDK